MSIIEEVDHKVKKAEYDRARRRRLLEELKAYDKARYAADPEKKKAMSKRYRKANPEKVAAYFNKLYHSNVKYRLGSILRNRVDRALRNGSAVRDLGCTIPDLKTHLESKFYPHPESGELMTWHNWGVYGWHIDHVVALAKFDLTDREQFLQAVNYKNLQPLWAEQNLSKGCK